MHLLRGLDSNGALCKALYNCSVATKTPYDSAESQIAFKGKIGIGKLKCICCSIAPQPPSSSFTLDLKADLAISVRIPAYPHDRLKL